VKILNLASILDHSPFESLSFRNEETYLKSKTNSGNADWPKDYFTLTRVLAASTRGKSHKNSHNLV